MPHTNCKIHEIIKKEKNKKRIVFLRYQHCLSKEITTSNECLFCDSCLVQSYKLPSVLYCQILPSFPWGTAVVVPVTSTASGQMGTVLPLPCRQLPCLLLAAALKQAALSSHRTVWNQSHTEIEIVTYLFSQTLRTDTPTGL